MTDNSGDSKPAEKERISEKSAIVTGASRGIGRAIATRLGSEGVSVIVNYRTNQDAAEDVVESIKNSGGVAVSAEADVRNNDDVERLLEVASTEFGTPDILVNNAGIARANDGSGTSMELWDSHIDTNLTGAFRLIEACLPRMKNNEWGRILNISSVSARNGGYIGPHYAASKAGLIGLTRFYAQSAAEEGITVNAIAPGVIDTEMLRDPPFGEEVTPVGRFGKPEEVAHIATAVIESGFVNGQTINVDGGIHFA